MSSNINQYHNERYADMLPIFKDYLEEIKLNSIRLDITKLGDVEFFGFVNHSCSSNQKEQSIPYPIRISTTITEMERIQIKNKVETMYSLLDLVQHNILNYVTGNESSSLIGEANNFIVDVAEYFFVQLSKVYGIETIDWENLTGLKRLYLFYYAHVNNTLDALYYIVQKINEKILRIDVLHDNMFFISADFIGKFQTKDLYYKFIDQFIVNSESYIKIYDDRSYDYLAEMYNKCPEFLYRENGKILFLKSQIMDNFTVDELLQLNNEDIRFLLNATLFQFTRTYRDKLRDQECFEQAEQENREKCKVLFTKYKQLKSLGLESEWIIKLIKYCPSFMCNILEKKKEKNKEKRKLKKY